VKTVAKKKSRAKKVGSKRGSKTVAKQTVARSKKSQSKSTPNPLSRNPAAQSAPLPTPPSLSQTFDESRVFTIAIDSIRAETTIGDLIVAFPRTRDVLMKHGLRFDVEEAGYLYLTLNVFSAIQGLGLTGLLQELDVASKELPLPPLAAPTRLIVSPPTT
jgi:hypothetical protein